MGDCWDYKVRKVEIAWELAKMAIKNREERNNLSRNPETFRKEVQEEIREAWEIVNGTFPSHEGKG